MRGVLIHAEPNSKKAAAVAGELGYLWSNLLQRGVAENQRAIGFCSIGDGEGSDMIAANLALFLGGKGKKVALVEATLRTPVLSTLFEVTGTPGLADLLAGRSSLRDVLRVGVAPGVDLVTAGASKDPFWSFTSDRFQTLLKELLADHDLCLVAVPGLNRAPETALVTRALDAVILAVEANRHRGEVVARNVAWLRSLGTPFLGAVLTDLVHDLPTSVARVL